MCSAALASEGKLLVECNLQLGNTHSEQLMPTIDMLLGSAGLEPADVDAVAVSIGPGSFTGIRIGLATAKGLSYGLGKPLIGVPTMQVMAFGCYAASGLIMPLIDAQKGRVYFSIFRWQDGALLEIVPVAIADARQAIAIAAGYQMPVTVVGEAAPDYSEALSEYGLCVAPPHIRLPKAGSVAMLGLELFAAGKASKGYDLTPLYVRRAEAEELWEARHGCKSDD